MIHDKCNKGVVCVWELWLHFLSFLHINWWIGDFSLLSVMNDLCIHTHTHYGSNRIQDDDGSKNKIKNYNYFSYIIWSLWWINFFFLFFAIETWKKKEKLTIFINNSLVLSPSHSKTNWHEQNIIISFFPSLLYSNTFFYEMLM